MKPSAIRCVRPERQNERARKGTRGRQTWTGAEREDVESSGRQNIHSELHSISRRLRDTGLDRYGLDEMAWSHESHKLLNDVPENI